MNANTKKMIYDMRRMAMGRSEIIDFRGLMEDAIYEAQGCLNGGTSKIVIEHIFSVEFEEAAQKSRKAGQNGLAEMLDDIFLKMEAVTQDFVLSELVRMARESVKE